MKSPRLKFVTQLDDYGDVVVEARAGRKIVGTLDTRRRGDDVQRVQTIEVAESHRRRGIATRMYEIAAREACKQGRSLASDTVRSDEAQAFWKKQVKKGRAKCAERGRAFWDQNKGGCAFYTLPCPAPKSLAGTKKR